MMDHQANGLNGARSNTGGSSRSMRMQLAGFEQMYKQMALLQRKVFGGRVDQQLRQTERFSRSISRTVSRFTETASRQFENLNNQVRAIFSNERLFDRFTYNSRMTFRDLDDEIRAMNDSMDEVFGRPRLNEMRRWERETNRSMDSVAENTDKQMGKVASTMEGIRSSIGEIAQIWQVGAIGDISSNLQRQQESTLEIGDKIRKQLGLTKKDWLDLYASGMSSLRGLNKEFDNKFSDTEFFEAMNGLIEIGVKSEERLKKLTPQLARFKKAMVDFDDADFSAFARMQETWGEEGQVTADLVADSMKKVSESFSVDTKKLTENLNNYNSSFMDWANGDIKKYKNLVDQFTAITTLQCRNCSELIH